eukprot:TRINITY_DN916_c0_g1_i1.p1 TRINITY_DN916_c0_g1~~TRINITY_DN916_c0_g1_i1.p1  ORF type:complete len:111 (-),score=21.39 TRINITY_DN916_c0_g1_i1:49-381(-)
MIRRPPRSTLSSSSAASDVYKRQIGRECEASDGAHAEQHNEGTGEEALALPGGRIGARRLDVNIKVDDVVALGWRHVPFSVIPVLCVDTCLLYTSPSPRDRTRSRMPSSA